MKLIKTEFKHQVNEASSWIVYITKSHEDARDIHQFALTQREMLTASTPDWYYTVSTSEVITDCRVPEFFHNRGYYVTVIEHNNGNWDAEQTYTLYLVQ